MIRVLIVSSFAFSITACVVNGPTSECSSNLDCGPEGTCTDGACMRPVVPAGPASCQPGTPITPATNSDVFASMIGRWVICDRQGLPLLKNENSEGVELATNRRWYHLGRDLTGELARLPGEEDSGFWMLDRALPASVWMARGPFTYAFSSNPTTLTLTWADKGRLVLAPVAPVPLACEQLPPNEPRIDNNCVTLGGRSSCTCPGDVDTGSGLEVCGADSTFGPCLCGMPELDRLRSGIIGRWSGTRTFGADVEDVYFHFDGRNFAASCHACDCDPFGNEIGAANDGYLIEELNADGSGRGMITGSGGTSLENVVLTADGNTLSFVAMHDVNGPATMQLTRMPIEAPRELALCEDQPATCECGVPRCCSTAIGAAVICLSCAPDECN